MPNFPRIFRVRQNFSTECVGDVAAEVVRQLATLDLAQRVTPGETVAITAGSRGVANIATILRATVDHFRGLQAEPFVVPAMGSHGGGTPQGQLEVLRSYGITEEAMGCPIRSEIWGYVFPGAPDARYDGRGLNPLLRHPGMVIHPPSRKRPSRPARIGCERTSPPPGEIRRLESDT